MRLKVARRWPNGNVLLSTEQDPDNPNPDKIRASCGAAWMQRKLSGTPQAPFTEAILSIPTTAHILGGAVIGTNRCSGVIGARHRAFGCETLPSATAQPCRPTSASTRASRSPHSPNARSPTPRPRAPRPSYPPPRPIRRCLSARTATLGEANRWPPPTHCRREPRRPRQRPQERSRSRTRPPARSSGTCPP